MTKKKLEYVKSQGELIEIESKINKELENTDMDNSTGNYLSSYDASQNNKISGDKQNEKLNDM